LALARNIQRLAPGDFCRFAAGRQGPISAQCKTNPGCKGATLACQRLGSVREVLQNSPARVGHGMMVIFDVTNLMEGPCHDQVEDSAVWR
jgi:hypothetical protein